MMTESVTLAAAIRAQKLLSQKPVIVDVETTGFSGNRDRIVQIGVVDHEGNTLLDTIINPGVPIPNGHIHGITDAMVVDSPTFADVYPTMVAALANKTVLAYNWQFDGSFIRGNCVQDKLEPPRMVGDCIMELFAKFYGEWNPRYKSYRWQKLATAAAHFDLDFEGAAHSALTDAKMALAVLKGMAAYADPPP
jgi:DNA polymerase III epsilon subunit-like protein